MDLQSEDGDQEPTSRLVQQRVNRHRAGAARTSVLLAMRELRRAFDELRAVFPGSGPDLDREEAMAEAAVLAAAPDLNLAMTRVNHEEAAARHRRMMMLGLAGASVAVVITGVVTEHRRRSRRSEAVRDRMRAPRDGGAITPPGSRRPGTTAPRDGPRTPPPRSLG